MSDSLRKIIVSAFIKYIFSWEIVSSIDGNAEQFIEQGIRDELHKTLKSDFLLNSQVHQTPEILAYITFLKFSWKWKDKFSIWERPQVLDKKKVT